MPRMSAIACTLFPTLSILGWCAHTPPTPGMLAQTAPPTPDLAGTPTVAPHSPDCSYMPQCSIVARVADCVAALTATAAGAARSPGGVPAKAAPTAASSAVVTERQSKAA